MLFDCAELFGTFVEPFFLRAKVLELCAEPFALCVELIVLCAEPLELCAGTLETIVQSLEIRAEPLEFRAERLELRAEMFAPFVQRWSLCAECLRLWTKPCNLSNRRNSHLVDN